jgi:hypothetical protein
MIEMIRMKAFLGLTPISPVPQDRTSIHHRRDGADHFTIIGLQEADRRNQAGFPASKARFCGSESRKN